MPPGTSVGQKCPTVVAPWRPRKIIKTRGRFPTDEAATNLIWLALRNITPVERTPHYWRAAMNQFAIVNEGRLSPTTA
jgi:transposase-like protein